MNGESKHLNKEAIERMRETLFTVDLVTDENSFQRDLVINSSATLEFYQDLGAAIGHENINAFVLESLEIALEKHRVQS